MADKRSVEDCALIVTALFVTAGGVRLLPNETDQPRSAMLVRTVGGTRAQVCVSLALCDGDPGEARRLAGQLARVGYLPPAQPMDRQEWERHRQILSEFHARIIWEVCGLGVPLGIALHRAQLPPQKHRNARRTIQRTMKSIGWSSQDDC